MTIHSYKAIIFDLGGVIINLDTQLTLDAFIQITGRSKSEVNDFILEQPAFVDYEKGKISDAQFRSVIKEFSIESLTDDRIDSAWNAMILDLPAERVETLKKLRKQKPIFLLSNTNYIHMRRVNEVREQAGLPEFSTVFNQDYYSHLMGMRKPDTEIFETVIRKHKMKADEVLFVDDNISNIEGAKRVGLQTLHVSSPDRMMEFFANV